MAMGRRLEIKNAGESFCFMGSITSYDILCFASKVPPPPKTVMIWLLMFSSVSDIICKLTQKTGLVMCVFYARSTNIFYKWLYCHGTSVHLL